MVTVADWIVILAYLAGIATLGVFWSRGQRSHRDYFLGNRSLPWWVVGLSIVATETSALTFIGVPAMAIGRLRLGAHGRIIAEGGNLRFAQLALGYVIARVVVAMHMVPHYFRGDVYTPYQLLRRTFGPWPRTLAAAMAVLNMCLQAGVRVYVTAIPVAIMIRTVYPGWGIWESIVLFAGVSILYSVAGGIRAVVWTDMVQFFIFIISGLYALLYIPTLLSAPGGATGWSALVELGREKLSLFHLGLDSVGDLLGGDFNIWMGLVGATVGVMVSHGADQLNVQRVLACRDERGGRRALFLSAAIIGPQFLMFLLIGVGLFALYAPSGFDLGGIPPWDPTVVGAFAAPKADYVFPIFIVTRIPPVVRGVMIAGVLASAMSSLTSALTAISSVVVMDLYRPLRGAAGAGPAAPGTPARRDVALGRVGTLLAGLVLIGVAWWAKDAPLVFNLVFQFAGVFAGAKLGSLLLSMWAARRERDRSGAGPVIGGMIASAALMAVIVLLVKNDLLQLRWPWYPAIGTLVCLGVVRVLGQR
jgi:SSS family transporter